MSTNVIQFAKNNYSLVAHESDKYLAMINIIRNIPILTNELNNSSVEELQSIKLELKTIFSDFHFNTDTFSAEELALGTKYSNLVFKCNIFNEDNFYVFRNSVYQLASNMCKEKESDLKDINDAIDLLLYNFLYNSHEVESGKDSLENLINIWAPHL